LPFTRRGKGGKGVLSIKGLPWQNSELSEMLVEFFYEFASENARNAVIELQE
jgi:translation initiation factor 1 (eIF-1/SUI1)